MSNKRLQIFNGIIFTSLLVVNLLIYKYRDNDYAYKDFLSYNQLYQAKEFNQINGLKLKTNDSIEIIASLPNQSFIITTPNNQSFNTLGNPTFKLLTGKHIYRIKNVNKTFQPIELGLNYTTKKMYAESGRNRESDVELYYCNIGLTKELKYSNNEWIQGSEYSTEEELKIIEAILKDSIKITKNETSIFKIEKIASYIYHHLDNCRGTPNNEMDELSPLQQFNFGVNKKSKLWCGNFANIFSFIANTAGIKTRLVCTEGKINEIYKSGHSFNECFIPEINKWIMVDITSKMIYAQSNTGDYLNTIDLYGAHQLNDNDIQITTFENDSIKKTNYQNNKSFYDYYFNHNTQFVYYLNSQFSKNTYDFVSKLKRYISQSPTFATYSGTEISSNEKFYLKKHMLYALLSFLAYWVLFTLLSSKKQIK